MAAKKAATKKAPAKSGAAKPKFGSPEWQKLYGKGKKKSKAKK